MKNIIKIQFSKFIMQTLSYNPHTLFTVHMAGNLHGLLR